MPAAKNYDRLFIKKQLEKEDLQSIGVLK